MRLFEAGNWIVTEEGIIWTGLLKGRNYAITKDRLTELGMGERSNMYDWLVHLTEKNWISVNDIYALNTAFIYALDYFKLDLNRGSFAETLEEQRKLMERRV